MTTDGWGSPRALSEETWGQAFAALGLAFDLRRYETFQADVEASLFDFPMLEHGFDRCLRPSEVDRELAALGDQVHALRVALTTVSEESDDLLEKHDLGGRDRLALAEELRIALNKITVARRDVAGAEGRHGLTTHGRTLLLGELVRAVLTIAPATKTGALTGFCRVILESAGIEAPEGMRLNREVGRRRSAISDI